MSDQLLDRLRKPFGASSQDGTWRLSDERADEIILDRRAAVAVIIGQQRDIANLKTALRDLLATLGDTAIVPPEQLVAARDAIAKGGSMNDHIGLPPDNPEGTKGLYANYGAAGCHHEWEQRCTRDREGLLTDSWEKCIHCGEEQ